MLKTALKDQKVFREFCKLDADRKGIITSILESVSIPYTLITIDDAVHILLYPKNLVSGEDATVLLAHYDRVERTPGANDNSASVFYLLYHAQKLKKLDHKTIIIFTDKEELTDENSITEQGAYGLGRYFRSKKMENLRFFVFDMCGIGSTVLLGTGGENLIKDHYGEKFNSSGIRNKINKVKVDAENTLLTVNGGEFFYLTPLFSDDLGLILNEYPAVLISLLPYREAVEYKQDPRNLPESWQVNHTLNDNLATLDKKSWQVLSPLLSRLSGIKETEVENNIKRFFFKCYCQTITKLFLVRGGIKKPQDYIIDQGFSIPIIHDFNDITYKYLLFSSKMETGAAAYISSLLENRTEDLSYDLYYYLESSFKNEYKTVSKIIKDKIEKKALENKSTIIDFLYNNIISHIKDGYKICSIPKNKKVEIELDFNKEEESLYKIKILVKSEEIGFLKVIKRSDGSIIDCGYFNPENFLRLDPLNLIKGIRILLIKWEKLNNNDSLRMNLTRSNWIGCDQFYRLLEMELEGKTSNPQGSQFIYLWKRYNG